METYVREFPTGDDNKCDVRIDTSTKIKNKIRIRGGRRHPIEPAACASKKYILVSNDDPVRCRCYTVSDNNRSCTNYYSLQIRRAKNICLFRTYLTRFSKYFFKSIRKNYSNNNNNNNVSKFVSAIYVQYVNILLKKFDSFLVNFYV